ncbi:MAG: hypothetical protein N3D73_01580 [Candidatus Diapherotrites archaeon]|nr:hypothetical protein [Candidatus Diapherotrites archaeon]
MIRETFDCYKNNFTIALLFGVLLIFLPIFIYASEINIEAGSILLDYSIMSKDSSSFVLSVIIILIFLLFYSTLTTLMIFAVRREISKSKTKYSILEQIEKFSFKIFAFYLILLLIIFSINFIILSNRLNIILGLVISTIIAIITYFVPQSIIIDEFSLTSALAANLDFIRRKSDYFIYALAAGFLLFLLVVIAEFIIDSIFGFGYYLTPILSAIFVVPFLESLKTVIYLSKFELLLTRKK